MRKVLISAAKYVQGENEIDKLGEFIQDFGNKAVIIASKGSFKRIRKSLDGLDKSIEIVEFYFGGESTSEEVDRFNAVVSESNCDVVIGLGGGKVIDTAKAAAMVSNKPVIIIPTIASTDAPCSSLSVIYKEDGTFDEYRIFRKNPDLVLVDTRMIAEAPTRFLVAGMGDALATKFEARACKRSNAQNIPGGYSTNLAIAASDICYEVLMEDGVKAMCACDQGVVTKALENVIEANILLSGMGFESSGLAAAHAIHNGLTIFEEAHGCYHGEKVAFGTLVQLVLENAPEEEFYEVLDFCKAVGLPTCLKDLGIKEIDMEKIYQVAEISCADGDTMGNMPFNVTLEDVVSAILVANSLGEEA